MGRAFPLLGFYLPLIILLIRSYPVNTIYSFHSSVHLFMFSFIVLDMCIATLAVNFFLG